MTKTYRVYRYYVGCHVYDVEADTPQKAHETLEGGGEVEFLHEANEPAENHFFTEVYEYDAEGDPKDDPEFVYNPACAKVWREGPLKKDVA